MPLSLDVFNRDIQASQGDYNTYQLSLTSDTESAKNDSISTSITYVNNNFLPLSGGTVTGTLALLGSLSGRGNPTVCFHSGLSLGNQSFSIGSGIAGGESSFAFGFNSFAGNNGFCGGYESVAAVAISFPFVPGGTIMTKVPGTDNLVWQVASTVPSLGYYSWIEYFTPLGQPGKTVFQFISTNPSTGIHDVRVVKPITGGYEGSWSQFYIDKIFATFAPGIISAPLSIGYQCRSSAENTVAIGFRSTALANRSIALGANSVASGEQAMAIGNFTSASGLNAFAAGFNSLATSDQAFTAGNSTQARGTNSVAFGLNSRAFSFASVAINSGQAYGSYSLAAGASTAFGEYSCSLGINTFAGSRNSIAAGNNSVTIANIGGGTFDNAPSCISLGDGTTAGGSGSIALGVRTISCGTGSLAEGYYTSSPSDYSHAEGNGSVAGQKVFVTYIDGSTNQITFSPSDYSQFNSVPINSVIKGYYNAFPGLTFGFKLLSRDSTTFKLSGTFDVSLPGSTSSGWLFAPGNNAAHAEGYLTVASGEASHSEGKQTNASGEASHSEGKQTNASGPASHSEGLETVAKNTASHAEGQYSQAIAPVSHAEGYQTKAYGAVSHAAGLRAASNSYSYVWADGDGDLDTTLPYISSTRTKQYMVSATNGFFVPGKMSIGVDNNSNSLTVQGILSSYDAIRFPFFGTTPSNTTTPVKWLDVYVNDTLYKLPLYQ